MTFDRVKMTLFYKTSSPQSLLLFKYKIASHLRYYFLQCQNQRYYRNLHLFKAFIANFITSSNSY